MEYQKIPTTKQALAMGAQAERRLTDKHYRRQEGGLVMHKTMQEPHLTIPNNELVRTSNRSKRTDISSTGNSSSYKFIKIRKGLDQHRGSHQV